MGSIFGNKIDYNRVEVVRGLAAQTQQKIDPSFPPPHLPTSPGYGSPILWSARERAQKMELS